MKEQRMAKETHTLQKDPPEGARSIIERELERQQGKRKDDRESRPPGVDPKEPKDPKTKSHR
jgi:hypothetical protein